MLDAPASVHVPCFPTRAMAGRRARCDERAPKTETRVLRLGSSTVEYIRPKRLEIRESEHFERGLCQGVRCFDDVRFRPRYIRRPGRRLFRRLMSAIDVYRIHSQCLRNLRVASGRCRLHRTRRFRVRTRCVAECRTPSKRRLVHRT